MLRITRLRTDDTVTFRLEGKLLEPWMDEVKAACTQSDPHSGHKALDLSELTYVDDSGLGLLRDLLHSGFEVTRCSSFVAELLRAEAQL